MWIPRWAEDVLDGWVPLTPKQGVPVGLATLLVWLALGAVIVGGFLFGV